MKDINEELEQILIKNGIIKDISLEDTVSQIVHFKSQLTPQSVIGIYGVSMEADSLLHFLFSYMPDLKIDICFDKMIPTYKYKNHIKEGKVRKIEELPCYHIDYMIIGSYGYREEMKQTLIQAGFQGEVVDFYDSLGAYIEEHYADYEMIFRTRQAFIKAEPIEKIGLTERLIKYYLNIRDFESAKDCIRDYAEHQYPGYERYIQLEKDIDHLLDGIRCYLNQRNEKDIILNWVDAVPYNKLDMFPFLKSKAETGVCFENAYTIMPWTRGTLRSILYGEYPISDLLFLRENFVTDEAETLALLRKNNYGFAYCGLSMYAKHFDDKVITTWDVYANKNVSSISRQWNALSLMCKSDQPLMILIHTMYETHGPYICGETDTFIRFTFSENDWADARCQKQAEVSARYMDKQLKFYAGFYGDNAYKIYMSDHGNVGDCIMEDHKVHIVFMIDHKDIKTERIVGMFSLVEFPQVIDTIIHEKYDWKSLERENVIVETYDAYDERKVNDILAGKLDKRDWLQCRGVITRKDKYFLFADGTEYYFHDGQEQKNEIDNQNYSGRIYELKQVCDAPFIDIYKYEEFKNSRRLYE